MSEEKKEEGAEEGAEVKKKKKSKLPLIIAAVVLLGGAGGGAAVFLGGGKDKKAEKEKEPEEHKVKPANGPLDTFIVNIGAANVFLKVTILVEYDAAAVERLTAASAHGAGGAKEAAPGLPAIFTERMPVIKDAVIRTLSSKTSESLLTTEGKEELKQELIDALNEALEAEEEIVLNVYFTEFLMQ